jgi:plasmid stability protein
MPTLYVENVPADLYSALRARAKLNRRSIAAEVLSLLEANVPTEKELRRRRDVVRKLMNLRSSVPPVPGTFPTAEEMIREDRER